MPLTQPVPKYLLGKDQMATTVLATALFGIVLSILSVPFSNGRVWFSLSETVPFLFTVGFFTLAIVIISLSRRMMYSLRGKKGISLVNYLLWLFAETALIALVYTILFLIGTDLGFFHIYVKSAPIVFLSALAFTAFITAVPTIICGQYFAINDKNNTISLMNFSNIVSDREPEPLQEKKITLMDDAGSIKMVVSLSNLYFIESDDNYIKVWYLDSNGQLKQYMLRCRLKTIEESFADSELVRCHRKYIVNISRVQVVSKTKDGYCIDLGLKDIEPIPISKTYEENFLTRFNSR